MRLVNICDGNGKWVRAWQFRAVCDFYHAGRRNLVFHKGETATSDTPSGQMMGIVPRLLRRQGCGSLREAFARIRLHGMTPSTGLMYWQDQGLPRKQWADNYPKSKRASDSHVFAFRSCKKERLSRTRASLEQLDGSGVAFMLRVRKPG